MLISTTGVSADARYLLVWHVRYLSEQRKSSFMLKLQSTTGCIGRLQWKLDTAIGRLPYVEK